MPMRVGEMMVIVRAQDFASRTLRRVSGELSGMSRAQMIAAQRSQVAFQKSQALSKLAAAQSNIKPLRLIERRNDLLAEQAMLTDRIASSQRRLTQLQNQRPRSSLGTFMPRTAATSAMMRGGQQQIAQLQKRLDIADNQVGRIDRVLGQLGGSYLRLMNSTYRFSQAQNAANAQLARAHDALTKAQRAQLAFDQALRSMPAARLAQVGHALSGIGRTMQLIGLIGTAVMAGASNQFANFNQQVMLAATQTRRLDQGWQATTKNAGVLTNSIHDLMMEFPANENEMSQAAYDIFSSMTVSFGGGIDLLKKFNQLSVATLTDLVTATSAGITVLNNFGGSSKDIDKTLNLMVATVRYGRMTLSDFNDMLNKVAPAAASAGLGLEDVAGAMALITTRQPSQRQGATQIARLLQVFMDPEFQQGVRQASNGMVDIVKAGGGLKPLPEVVNMLARSFKQLSTQKGAAEFFRQMTAVGRGSGRGRTDRIEAQRGWIFLSKNLAAYNDLQKKTTSNTDEFAQALKAMSESPGVRWQVMINQFRVLILLIGEKAIPVFLQIGDALQKVIRWFKNLDEGMRNSIVRWGAMAGIATLAAGVMLGIAGPIVAMIAHFKMWRLAAAGAEAKTLTLVGAMRLLPLIGFGVLLTQVVGLQRALTILALGFVAWKTVAIASAVAVAIAHRTAATTFALAWRTALIRTGWGALVIAAGLAAEYVIRHWTEVKDYFRDFWDWLRVESYQAALDIVEPFSHIKGKLGDWARDAKRDLESGIGQIRMDSHMREMAEGSAKWMDKMLKETPRKIAFMRKRLQQQLKAGDFAGGENAQTVRASLKVITDAYARAWQAKKKAKMDTVGADFSEEFWKTGGKSWKDFSQQLQDLYGDQVDGTNDVMRKQKELADLIINTTQQTVDSLQTMYMGMEQANRDAFGELFQGPWLTSPTFDLAKEWGIKPGIEDMIRDLGAQNAKFMRWRTSLDKLMSKGLPRGFINEIRKMGPEAGQSFLDNIINAKPEQVRRMIAKWKQRESQIKSQTKMDFTDEIERFRKAGVNMGDAIINGFTDAQVGVWFDGWIKMKFPTIISAAVNTAVADWKAANPSEKSKVLPTGASGTGTGIGTGGLGAKIGIRAGAGMGMGLSSVDNSKTVTVEVKIDDTKGSPGAGRGPIDQRRLAWIIANAIRNHS